ncbi:LEAF RUST 10 DISEASE-RESISTANCE LOCUS RECEPTOR-LIKE PROTEIN KINASE-like 2.5 [Chenopodium quinoa]|uniref:LEAF RUST 10 DISEASE-RESISTANCE LOCUS RECEPTOR-LIKE PROTEIN KINASE-like 2.5 n=1 Tax=Chenopodium quinoa TaxID=63459 RepID=UPI000B791420|nr:LEAF RUST 10 DISEASE-RESISTANCE LOCUS RECEPTOR-LIKE PROTEIN KINASE-like 2.5 [Chenopodium quinoa]
MKLSFQSSFFLMIIIFLLILLHVSVEANKYKECKSLIQCGGLSDIGYPFYDEKTRPDYCGYPGFKLDCDNEYGGIPEISVTQSLEKHRLLNINTSSHTISVTPKEFWNTSCPDTDNLFNTTLNYTLYKYTDEVANFTFYYDCPTPFPVMSSPGSATPYDCLNINYSFPVVYFKIGDNYIPQIPCQSNIIVPLFHQSRDILKDSDSVKSAFEKGFELEWIADNGKCDDCQKSGGECGYDFSQRNFTCYHGSSHPKERLKRTLIIIASLVVGSAMVAIVLFYFTRTKASQKLILTKEERNDSQDVEVMLKRYGEHAPKRYTYGEIKKMTSCFQEKLGEGGYGGVYKGILQDGSPVAVKSLKNHSSKGADFINEIASISETNHVNIVTLLGYCYQGRKSALVYEFLPNGSLDKYIYCGQNQNSIAWETLLQIVIGIGRGLEYLHQGCRTRILHFDIKPHNILLDAKFCPKISDFGLAKSYVQTKSLMTMSGTRGTPGYIAPEVFCRGFGGASHKSDVYSFGMLVLDLVGCRKNSIAGSEKTGSELYFPHYIYKQFELKDDHELKEEHELLGISNDEEKAIQKKLVIVSLWCIQTNPSSRPSISRAVEMLEGDIESLQIPPIPFMSSPPKSNNQHSSINSATLELHLTNGSSE